MVWVTEAKIFSFLTLLSPLPYLIFKIIQKQPLKIFILNLQTVTEY